jgi:hypothetical protein
LHVLQASGVLQSHERAIWSHALRAIGSSTMSLSVGKWNATKLFEEFELVTTCLPGINFSISCTRTAHSIPLPHFQASRSAATSILSRTQKVRWPPAASACTQGRTPPTCACEQGRGTAGAEQLEGKWCADHKWPRYKLYRTGVRMPISDGLCVTSGWAMADDQCARAQLCKVQRCRHPLHESMFAISSTRIHLQQQLM